MEKMKWFGMLGIFLDIETNGLSPFKHKPIELAFKILEMKTGNPVDRYETIISPSYKEWMGSDPSSLQVNGFSWEKTRSGISIEDTSNQVQKHFLQQNIRRGHAVFICQNPSFDRAFFAQIIDPELQEKFLWPYHWLDLASMYWAVSLLERKSKTSPYPWDVGFSKDQIAKTLNIPPESKPHKAMNGVDHLILCYEAIIGFPN